MLLRHGETEWSKSGQHTSTTDLELTDVGREQARLAALTLTHLDLEDPIVFSSPRRRAVSTAELAGLTVDEVTPLLAEWNYGEYEGMTTREIRTAVPSWLLWTLRLPRRRVGRSGQRCAPTRPSTLASTHMESRDVVFVGHGHFSRSVITRWVEQPVYEGIRFAFAAGVDRGVRLRIRAAPAQRARTDRLTANPSVLT